MEQMNNIKKRINAVGEIRKMTKAMALISAVRMRDSREQEALTHPFVAQCALTITELFKRSPDIIEKYLNFKPYEKDEVYPLMFYLLTGDKGLSGDFNQSIVKLAEKMAENRRRELNEQGYKKVSVEFKFCGKVGPDLVHNMDFVFNDGFSFSIEEPTYYRSMDLADEVYETAKSRRGAEIYFIYCRLATAITVEPNYTRIFPLDEAGMLWLSENKDQRENEKKQASEQRKRFDEDFSKATGIRATRRQHKETKIGDSSEDQLILPFAFEGDRDKVISYLLSTYLNALVYGLLTESYASEQLSRMTSMDSATSNADGLLSQLIRERNRFRQKQITTELTEIIGGAEAIMQGD